MDGLRAIASDRTGVFRLTPNQNLIIANIAAGGSAPSIEELLERARTYHADQAPRALRLNAMACVAIADLRPGRWPRASATCRDLVTEDRGPSRATA